MSWNGFKIGWTNGPRLDGGGVGSRLDIIGLFNMRCSFHIWFSIGCALRTLIKQTSCFVLFSFSKRGFDVTKGSINPLKIDLFNNML